MSAPSRADRVVACLAALACALFLVTIPGASHVRRLAVSAATQPAGAPLRVVVREAGTRATLPGATVRIFHQRGDRYLPVGDGKTDEGGAFGIPDVPRGSVWLLAEADGYARASSQLAMESGARTIEFQLEKANRLRVRVEDDRGAALVGANVLVTGNDALPFGALTNAEGTARFDRLGRAPYTLRVAARGFESITRADVVGDVTVVLKPLSAFVVLTRAADGQPVAGATVLIAGPSLWPARRATANAEGRALISGLEAGLYDLKAMKGSSVSDTHVGVELDRGERQTVTLTLTPGRMVTALVTDGESESPIVVPNADVVLAEGGLSSFPLQGRTDTLGKVVLGPIAPGPAVLAARADGFVARAAVPVPEDVSEPLRIPLLRGATLHGEVVDAAGRGVDGATIEVVGTDLEGLPIAETPMSIAFRKSHFDWALPGPAPLIPAGELGVMPGPIPPIPMPGSMPGATALALSVATAPAPWVTRFDGTFDAKPVPPGRVRALVRHPAYVEALSDAVTLGPGGEATVKVVLSAGGSIEGRVVDEHGIPVAGVRVDVVAVVGTLQRSTLSSTDGSFAFAAVPGEVTLAVARPDDLSRIVHRETLSIEEGERRELEIVLAAPREPIAVSVVGEDGMPVPMAQVTALSLDPRAPLRETQFADDQGQVEFEDARGLSLRLVVEAPGYSRYTGVLDSAPESVAVTLTAGVLVEGEVTAVRGRAAVSGATVTLTTAGQRKVAFTDAEGRYRLTDIAPGRATITVSHPDYADAETSVVVRGTGRADRAFEVPTVDLQEAGRVSGVVVDAAGKPVASARVAVGIVPAFLPVGALPPGMARADAAGRFTIQDVTPGTVTLEAYAVDVGRGRVDGVPVQAGIETDDVTIRLTEPADDTEPAAPATLATTLGERTADGFTELVVVHVAAGSEAERGGLSVGDVLLEVDGVEPDSLERARALLSGAEGSDVVVLVERGRREVPLRLRRERVRR